MPPERLYAHPKVRMDVGRVALRRGPLIYCVEESDNAGAAVQSLTLPRAAGLGAEWRTDVFDGAMTLIGEGWRLDFGDAEGALYTPTRPCLQAHKVTAVPYHLWANREPGSMQVWIGETVE